MLVVEVKIIWDRWTAAMLLKSSHLRYSSPLFSILESSLAEKEEEKIRILYVQSKRRPYTFYKLLALQLLYQTLPFTEGSVYLHPRIVNVINIIYGMLTTGGPEPNIICPSIHTPSPRPWPRTGPRTRTRS